MAYLYTFSLKKPCVRHTMARKGYTTIALQNRLMEQVEKINAENKDGHTSKPEFIKAAIREKIGRD